MLRVTSQNGKTKRRVRFRGINADADRLDVSRQHLWMVLTGRRKSEKLLRQYKRLAK